MEAYKQEDISKAQELKHTPCKPAPALRETSYMIGRERVKVRTLSMMDAQIDAVEVVVNEVVK